MEQIEKRKRGRPPAKDVTVIKSSIFNKTKVMGHDWDISFNKSKEIEKISEEIEKDLDRLIPKFKDLNNLIADAYRAAPETDCGFQMSPAGPGRIMIAFKNHFRKNNFSIDHAYIGDVTKLPNFSDYVKEAMKWLMKFSTMGKGGVNA